MKINKNIIFPDSPFAPQNRQISNQSCLRKRLLLILLLPIQCFAQDITGMWTGFLQTADSVLHYELAISGNQQKLDGYSLTIFMIEGVENSGVKSIKLKNKKGKISLEDGIMIYNNHTTPPKRVVLFGDLLLKVNDSVMILEGTFSTRSLDMRFPERNLHKGIIHLQKQNNLSQCKLISKLDEMNLLNNLSFIPSEFKEKNVVAIAGKLKEPSIIKSAPKGVVSASVPAASPRIKTSPATNTDNNTIRIAERKTEILTTVYLISDSISISLFDNGEIDGDTVSVFLNDKIIIFKKGLTTKAITQIIYLPSFTGDSLVLVMYAENLGSIPPNTGLLILQDGDVRHEIRFAGDLQKNSAIILRRRE